MNFKATFSPTKSYNYFCTSFGIYGSSIFSSSEISFSFFSFSSFTSYFHTFKRVSAYKLISSS
jgi:hypothetical protein